MSEETVPAAAAARPGGGARSLAVVALAVGLLAALVQLPHDLRRSGLSAPSHEKRQLAPLQSVDLDPRLFAVAEQLLPRDAVYTIVTGSDVQVSSPITFDAIRPLAGFWLLPRRQTQFPHRAEWVLSFGGDLQSLGFRYRRVVPVAPGVAIGEVAR